MEWSAERDDCGDGIPRWQHEGSNLLLDFHGDPAAELVIFSDGNHHMALGEAVDLFRRRQLEPPDIFYATTPPGPIVKLLTAGRLRLGNFLLRTTPHLFIGPPAVLDDLAAAGHLTRRRPFVCNQGNVLLVRRGNPRQIGSVNDLAQPGIRVFLSNPDTEAASHRSYRDTLVNLSGDARFEDRLDLVYGSCIHHREAPAALAQGAVDAAPLFYHLALCFTRRFPDVFEMVPLGGSREAPVPLPGNPVGHTHAGLVGAGGRFGQRFLDFLASQPVGEIYRRHGLVPL